jgi:hypothetical protein
MLNTANYQERRQHLRRSVVTNVQLDHDILGKTVGASVNISDSGLLLLVDALVQQAFPVEARIKLSLLDSLNPEIIFSADVVRNNDHGLAVKLIDYEFRGKRYPLGELRRQWFMSQKDLSSQQ